MDIKKKNDDVLVLEHVPTNWIIGLGAVCLVLLIAFFRALIEGALSGIVISVLMLAPLSWIMLTRVVRRLQLTADRTTDSLQLKAHTPLALKVVDYPLSALARTEVQTRHGSQSIPESMLVLLLADVVPPRRIQFDAFRPDPAALLVASEQINQWLAAGPAAADQPGASAAPATEPPGQGPSPQ